MTRAARRLLAERREGSAPPPGNRFSGGWSPLGLRELARRVAAVLASQATPALAGVGPMLQKAAGDSPADPSMVRAEDGETAQPEPPGDTWQLVSLAQQGDG